MNHPLLVSHADLFMRRRRALSTKTLYNLLRKSYEEADSSWKLKEVKRQIRKYDEGSVGLGASVLRCLRGLSALTPEMEMELIQGFSVGLRRRGWGVVLHTALAETVRAQVLELSRKRFHAVRRRVGLKPAKFRKAAIADVLEKIEEYEPGSGGGSDGDDGDDAEETEGGGKRRRLSCGSGGKRMQEYLVGYTLVPPNQMGDGHENFDTAFAFDGASKTERASGVRQVHPAPLQDTTVTRAHEVITTL